MSRNSHGIASLRHQAVTICPSDVTERLRVAIVKVPSFGMASRALIARFNVTWLSRPLSPLIDQRPGCKIHRQRHSFA